MRREIRARDQPAHLRRGLDSFRADRGARGRPPRGGLPTTSATVGGGLPRREVLRPVSAKARRAEIPASRLLHRCPRGGRGPGAAHPRCHALPHLLPRPRDHAESARERRDLRRAVVEPEPAGLDLRRTVAGREAHLPLQAVDERLAADVAVGRGVGVAPTSKETSNCFPMGLPSPYCNCHAVV